MKWCEKTYIWWFCKKRRTFDVKPIQYNATKYIVVETVCFELFLYYSIVSNITFFKRVFWKSQNYNKAHWKLKQVVCDFGPKFPKETQSKRHSLSGLDILFLRTVCFTLKGKLQIPTDTRLFEEEIERSRWYKIYNISTEMSRFTSPEPTIKICFCSPSREKWL